MRHRTDLVFDYDSAALARTVERSVAREADDLADDRSVPTVTRDGATVRVAVEADDLTALRAGDATWCSLVEVAERAAAAGDRHG